MSWSFDQTYALMVQADMALSKAQHTWGDGEDIHEHIIKVQNELDGLIRATQNRLIDLWGLRSKEPK